jgi:2-polyprenyl-6-methoxyphenol hydroxylase-like FAD-dependent oxidoreductase
VSSIRSGIGGKVRGKSEYEHGTDVLIVGAGPTGLTLCAQLLLFGVRSRIVDRALDRAHESRALAVQARTLELLQGLDLADALVGRGNTSARLMLHFDGRVVGEAQLGGFAAVDTRFPFILFVSQAETEALLGEHLASKGVMIERGVELIGFEAHTDVVKCILRHRDGQEEHLWARYLVGCDGAHSTVRKGAAISFDGDAYLQDFMLADIEADARPDVRLQRDTLHSFTGGDGIAMFFPLGRPTTWRVIAMSGKAAKQGRNTASVEDKPIAGELSLEELQGVVDGATGGLVRLRDPKWLTHFRLHHRQAAHYRAGRVFLAGDAGHIHSPVGAQGMNTGIQDAWNLGWKLALVSSGAAHPKLLESYEAERWPVGRALLRYTDRIFSVFVRSISNSAVVVWFRRAVVARVLPRILSSKRLRTFAFQFISELSIRYRNSALVTEGEPRLREGPQAGDRLPDAKLTRDGRPTHLLKEVRGPSFHLLLCGTSEGWSADDIADLTGRYREILVLHYLSPNSAANILVDSSGEALTRLGVSNAGQYLVRPDGYIAYRCGERDLRGVKQYLANWLV